jgi:beta-mannosidase
LWYALRRSYADRLLTVQPREEGLAAVAVNDSLSPWASSLEVRRQDFAGTVLAEVKLDVNVAPGEAQVVALPSQLTTPTDALAEVLVVGTGDHRALWFWAEDKDLRLPPPGLHAEARAIAGGYEVEVSATSLQRDVALLVDKVDAAAEVDDMLVTVLPGDRVRFRIKSGSQVAPARFLGPQVLRSINQLAHGLPT